MQKETMTTAGSVDAGTHSHTVKHSLTHTLTLSFIQSRQGQEQGDKCYSPELKRNFEIKEMFAPTQCRGVGSGGERGGRGVSGKSYARHFQLLSLNQASTPQKTQAKAKVQETNTTAQAEGAVWQARWGVID